MFGLAGVSFSNIYAFIIESETFHNLHKLNLPEIKENPMTTMMISFAAADNTNM